MVVTAALTVAVGTRVLKALLHAVEDRTWVVEKLCVHVWEVFHTAAAIVSGSRRKRRRRPGRRNASSFSNINIILDSG
jgi:hypothetical protein